MFPTKFNPNVLQVEVEDKQLYSGVGLYDDDPASCPRSPHCRYGPEPVHRPVSLV